MSKKKIPLALRKVIDELAGDCKDLVNISFGTDFIVKFEDADPESDFYFQIDKVHWLPIMGGIYDVSFRPYGKIRITTESRGGSLRNFKNYFNKWKQLLIESNEQSSVFDDNITQSYYEELRPNFENVDEDAGYKPFTLDQQKRIVAYLDSTKKVILEHIQKDNYSKDVIDLIEGAKESISRSTKKQVIRNIRQIIAKGFKISLKIGERMLLEFTTDLAAKLLLGP